MTTNTSVLCGPVDPRLDELLDELYQHDALDVSDLLEDPVGCLVEAVHDLLLLETQISAECVALTAENVVLSAA